MKNLCLLITALILSACSPNSDIRIAESQQKWIEVYEKQENFPNPEDMLVNTDPKPELGSRFVSLYNGKNLDGWNRITISARGETIKTWLNGVPAAHWKTNEYKQGFFSLQVHSGKSGQALFRNIKVKEL